MNQAAGSTRNARDFFRIVKVASALGFGFTSAILYSLRGSPTGISLSITKGALGAFVVGALVAWLYWVMVIRLAFSGADRESGAAGAGRARRRFVRFSVILFLAGVAGFLYPLRFVPSERMWEIVQGLALAAVFLSGVGFLIWRIKRFLDRDAAAGDRESQ